MDFIAWEKMSRDTIEVKRVYVDIGGDLETGILLSQIIYWWLPDKTGRTKLRVMKDGRLWLAKTRAEWWDECRIKPKTFDRAIKRLRSKNIVETKVKMFSARRTIHIWLNIETLLAEVHRYVNNEVSSQTGNMDVPKLGATIT